MKKIGKESTGSELFTVIEPGLPSNRLSEMEKSLILGGEYDTNCCLPYNPGCPVACEGYGCTEYDDCILDICIFGPDPCLEETIVPSWPIDDFGSGCSGSDCSGSDSFGEYSFCFELN